ncbi:uncharacterized protein LOC144434783 [Glandiceps talaboti]
MAALWKKVSDILGITNDAVKAPPLDGEIIYCKNNVCVHPPTKLSSQIEHHPGYLTIRAAEEEDVGSTLILTWIPNASLKKNRKKAVRYFSPQGSPVHSRFGRGKYMSADGISLSSLGSVSQDSISIASSEAERVITSEILRERLERKQKEEEAQAEASESQNPEESEEPSEDVLNNSKRPSKEKLPGIGKHVNMLNEKNNIDKAENGEPNRPGFENDRKDIGSTKAGNGDSETPALEGSNTVDNSTKTENAGDVNSPALVLSEIEGGNTNTDMSETTHPQVPNSLPVNVELSPTHSDSDVSPGYGMVREVGRLAVEREPLLPDSDDCGGKSDVEESSHDRRETDGAIVRNYGDEAHHEDGVAMDTSTKEQVGLDGTQPYEVLTNENQEIEAHDQDIQNVAEDKRKRHFIVQTRNPATSSPAKSVGSDSTDSEVMTTNNQLHHLLQKSGLENTTEDMETKEEKPERPTDLKVHMKKVIHTAVGDFEEDSPSSDSTNPSPYPSPYKSLIYGSNAEKTVLHVDPSLSAVVHSDASSSTTPTTSNRDPMSLPSTPTDSSCPPTPTPSDPSSPAFAGDKHKSMLEENPESFAMTHNLTFPENSVRYASPSKKNTSPKEQLLGVFSVDLGEMRSLRLFFSDEECTSGQLVIASRESQYKIIHFHHGGLDKLAEVFEDWKICVKHKAKGHAEMEANQLCRKFSICRPHLLVADCHPEEGLYEMVGDEVWWSYVNDQGQIEDNDGLRKAIFFGGLDEYLRRDVWPFLLGYFRYESTVEERNSMRGKKREEYYAIQDKREEMCGDEYEEFWRNVQCTVDKDVVRTDRSHPYFRGENNPNIDVMRNILLNYAIFNPSMGYTQGMSDLLAPVLAEIQDESDSFWCFVGLMQNTIFVSSPTDDDMEKQLAYLRALLELLLPDFWEHLVDLGDAMDLLFCHRWILLCFKREFPEPDALRMWEACWSHFQTDYFHLFICVSIIAIYGADIVEQKLPSDEMLLHFSSLAMHMSGDLVLRKARGLLHLFRILPRIPCTLDGLCEMCDPGMWDSGHTPEIFCIGDHDEGFKCRHSYSDENLKEKLQPIKISP